MTTLSRPGIAVPLLGGAPDAPALLTADGVVTYAELTTLVAAEAARLGSTRRLRLLSMGNDVDSVVALLGAIVARHPVVLLGPEDAARHDAIRATYADAADLHPDLALLLSTSGSTGSPKLVRISHDNLLANARSIAEYLVLDATDRAITSLPLHYCYGLSVLTSHLTAGAGVVLTDLSVADECFWTLARSARTTGFAGVPYTFDLLDSSGFAERDLPDLRYVTQAGGRMAPAQVVRYAELGRARGWDLVVMYGQTEATARMAYLPPYLATTRPHAIGVPIPGGHLRLAPVDGVADGVGELVYSGPNVMMGYAEHAADLARGPELTELRTGDLARQADDGLWEVCGRLDRHAKVFGLRLDLARLEVAAPCPTAVVAVGDVVHAFVDRPRVTDAVRAALVAAGGLPVGAVAVHRVDRIPTTARGKPDLAALRKHAETLARSAPDGGASADDLRDLLAVTLGRPDAGPDDTFVGLGGDSLSFVEISTQLGQRLGHLPAGWQHLTPRELAATARRRRRLTTPLEIPVVLRALAIVAIVVSHTDLWLLLGGAHVLLAVAGYNLARFTLPVAGRRERVRRIGLSVAALAVPTSLWIGTVGLVTGDYRPTTALYLNGVSGADRWTLDWQFWFLETLVWGLLGLALLLAVPAVDRWQRRWPFGVAVAAVALTLIWRYATVGVGAERLETYLVPATLWCIALGWAAAEARGVWPRLLVAALAVAGTWGYFTDDLHRQLVVVIGVALLVVPRAVPVPRLLATPLRVLAAASLWIYLTHWQVYPGLEAAGRPVLAVLASLAVGVVAAGLYGRLTPFGRRRPRAAGRDRQPQAPAAPGRRRLRAGRR